MLAPIEAAWLFLKAQPTERDQRNMNERMEPFDASMIDSHYPYMRGEEEPQDSERVSEMPANRPPMKPAKFDEGPTMAELADMDPEEAEFYRREAGRRSAASGPSGQRTLHDY
jgi:hypothetical protein